MYKTARKRFVVVSSIILLVSFSILFGVTCFILRNTVSKNIVKNINDVQVVFSSSQDATAPPNGLFAEFSVDYLGNITIINSKYDTHAFENENVERLIQQVAGQEHTLNVGNVDNFYYKIVDGNPKTVYGFDASVLIDFYYSNVTKAAISLIILCLILCILTVILSTIICKPLIENIERQKRFISDASHELKTPLAVISASADVLQGETDSKWVQNIKQQTTRMTTLVTDMLSLAKLEEDNLPVKKENFDLSEEIVNCSLPFEALSFENGIRINYHIQEKIRVNTDRNSVKLLVNILMDNACKYASKDGTIEISLSQKKKSIVFSVFNTGSNVPDKDSSKIFERFYRGDQSRSRQSGGSGLGLAIAKELANKNKWKIYADSKLGQSMTITVLF